MAVAPPLGPDARLARQAREQFAAEVEGILIEMAASVQGRLTALADQSGMARDMQERRDALLAFQQLRSRWIDGMHQGWRAALLPAPVAPARAPRDADQFALIDDEEVESKILASRLVLAILDKANWELSDLRLRIQRLEGTQELASQDVLRPDVVAGLLVQQWTGCGLTREVWAMVQDVIQQHLVERLVEAYHHANEFLIQRGVMPEIDLKPLVKRTGAGGFASIRRQAEAQAGSAESGASGLGGGSGPGGGSGGGGGSANGGPAGGAGGGLGASTAAGPVGGGRSGAGAGGPADETRLLTAGTPLARVRMRAQGVLGQLRRLLSDRVSDFDMTRPTQPSPALAQAMAQAPVSYGTAYEDPGVAYDSGSVEQVARQLRQRTSELKNRAASSSEKATIEIVALMFQSILAEERIPASVRVWFARLQMPVLRVALGEPEFFGTLEHPARQLIDRMGSCVMGFDAAAINGSALEAEIKRVVQVIEQYPETGRRVFQLVYDEFQNFLSRFLSETGLTRRVATVAQQVEQKETMAIQYTIELRNMLNAMPVRDEIRGFLFKIWSEVLAIAAVKNGPQHEDTIALKRSAADLVWAASAKPNRNDRTRVIQDLPTLLQRLRQGMNLLGVTGSAQEAHIKVIGDTLADAFLSKTEAIPQAQIEAMAKRLAHLEDFVSDDGTGELPLDTESIELMLGIDASSIDVVADGGSQPSAAMMAWAQELQLAHWFTLDHNGHISQVQYVWRSERRQLHLFAASDGRSYLIQLRRLAAYLQAGLLVPAEEEALTVRATREALAKLDANPERLLG